MRTFPVRPIVIVLAASFALFLASAPAHAQAKSKRVETEGELVKFDPAAKTMTVKVTKTGRAPGALANTVKRGKQVDFKVKPEGTVLTRTTVKINGMKAELADIPVGKTMKITWKPDEADKTKPFAWTVDTVLSEEEFEERYGAEDVN